MHLSRNCPFSSKTNLHLEPPGKFCRDISGAECTKIARFSAAAAAIFTAPQKIARFFEAPRCAISSAKKVASEPRFLLRIKWVKMALAAEFLAMPSSAAKIASERRCAILVHSARGCPKLRDDLSEARLGLAALSGCESRSLWMFEQ